MPKKKNKRRPHKPAANRGQRGPNQTERLVEAFRGWRTERGLDPDDAWIMEPLIQLKADYFGVCDPTVWPDQETYELLTQVMPRKVHVEEADYERIAPTVGDFFTFLHDTGRWSPRSLPFADVPDLVGELTNDMPQTLADPANRSMGGNIVSHMLSQGVDVSDEAAVAAFIQQFNAMDDDARHAITDTGRPASTPGEHTPGAAFGLGAAPGGQGATFRPPPGQRHLPAVPDDADLSPFDDIAFDDIAFDGFLSAGLWPEFLGTAPDGDAVEQVMLNADLEYVASAPLTLRADRVMALLTGGRKLTDSHGLRRADSAELLAAFGIGGGVRSMWDVPALALLWLALIDAGFVEIRAGSAHPAALIVPWAGPAGDAEDRLAAARLLHATAFQVVLGDPDEGLGEFEGTDDGASPFTYMALMRAIMPDGVTVHPTRDLNLAFVVAEVKHDLRTLAEVGLLTEAEDAFHLHPTLLPLLPPAVAAAMDEIEDLDDEI